MLLIVSLVLIVAALIVLGVAKRTLGLARANNRRAVLANREAREVLQRAEERSGGKITVEHKKDPVLGPRHLLLVVLPDPDWETVHEMGSDTPTTIIADSKKAIEAFAEAEYVVGVYAHTGHLVVGKWREFPGEAIEVLTYGAE